MKPKDDPRSPAAHVDRHQPPLLSGYSPKLYSKLYCRLNGFMFGVFLELCKYSLARDRYPFYRRRLQFFLDEIAVPSEVPGQHAEFVAWADDEVHVLIDFFSRRPHGLVRYFGIGHLAVTYVLKRLRNRPEAEDARRAAHELLRAEKLSTAAFDALVDPAGKPARSADEIVSPALKLATALLRGLSPERRTCFLAMPFREPYEDYYDAYYRPLIAALGMRCVRAWGGFGQEDFSPLLVTLILKSGGMLADLTENSPNVLWEVGVAQGAGKRVFLVRDAVHDVPADLSKHVTFVYDPRSKAWPQDAIEMHHLLVLMQIAAMQKHGRDPVRIAAGIRIADVDELLLRTRDLFSDIPLFTARERGENDANGRIQRGLERIKERRWLDAEADFDYGLAHGGHAGAAHFGRGMVRLQTHRHEDAELDLSAAIEAGVDDADVLHFRAMARAALLRDRAALADLDRALEMEPRNLGALQLRALVRARLGRVTDAAHDWRKAARIAPRHPGTHGAKGFIELARRDFAAAVASFRQARGKAFGKGWRFEAGLAALLAGDFDAARREYEIGLLRATDADIEDGLQELAFWSRRQRVGGRSGYREAIGKTRRRLQEILGPGR